MSRYDLKRQFIDSAARTLWAGAWGDERERIIEDWNGNESLRRIIRDIETKDRLTGDVSWEIGTWGEYQPQGHRAFTPVKGDTIYLFDDEVMSDEAAELNDYLATRGYPRSMQGVELTEAAPPTPDYARLEAAILLGKLEQANGCELA